MSSTTGGSSRLQFTNRSNFIDCRFCLSHMMTMQQYCLRWNNHQPNFISVFSSLLSNESLVDVTLAAEGRHLQAHKVVLSACSSYFQSLFTINPCQHPIVILKDVKFIDLKVMVDFMYYGEVNVSQDQLPYILKTAEMLKIKGLAEIPVETSLSKTPSGSIDRAELLTPSDTNWSCDGLQNQSLSPSQCPLSPTIKRKRLRKSSTGSGSGSTERTSEELLPPNEVILTSPGGSTSGTVIKPDPGGFKSEPTTPIRMKQHSSDSDISHRGSSSIHESTESDTSHQITLQVPQQDLSHNLESSSASDIPGFSASPQQTVAGLQWGIIDGVYPRFALSTSQSNISVQNDVQYTTSAISQCSVNDDPSLADSPPSTVNTNHISCSPTQMMQKRKRSINPQADENFVRALDAVRFGGIGFCKAAKMYGVNNRTLWLEFKKRGYPNNRMSIKNRKQEFAVPAPVSKSQSPLPSVSANSEEGDVIVCNTNHPVSMIAGAIFEGRHLDLAPMLQRSRYLDHTQQPAITVQGINFEHM